MSTVTWKKAASGDWSSAAKWSTGKVPGAADAVAIAAAGSYTVSIASPQAAKSLTIASAKATVLVNAAFAVGGVLALNAGTLNLMTGGVLQGGTLSIGPSGRFVAAGGTLSGTTVSGALAITAANASLTVAGNLTLTGAGGMGPGALTLGGGRARLTFNDATALNNATVTVGAKPGNTLVFANAAGAGNETVTLGPGLTLNAVAASTIDLAANGAFGETLVSQGTLTVTAAASSLTFVQIASGAGAGAFVNQGSIAIGAGDRLTVGAASFANAGTITVQGGTLAVGAYANTGSISVSSGSLQLNAAGLPDTQTSLAGFGKLSLSNGATLSLGSLTVTTAALQGIAISGGATVQGNGSIDNSGATLSLGAGTGITQLVLNGAISGGTIQDAGGGLAWGQGSGTNVTLSNVVYQGALNSYSADHSLPGGFVLGSGFTLTGTGGVGAGALNIMNSTMVWTSGASLANAAINIEDGVLVLSRPAGAGAPFVIGASQVVDDRPLYSSSGGMFIDAAPGQSDTLDNQGTLNFTNGAGFASGLLLDQSGQELLNQGLISISNHERVQIDAATLDNQGTILVSGASLLFGGNGQDPFPTNPGAAPEIPITFTNTGTFEIGAGGTLVLEAPEATSFLSQIQFDAGSTLQIAGSLDNAGATLNIATAPAPIVLGGPGAWLEGFITGGTIADASGALTINSGQLSNVTYDGTLNDTVEDATLTIAGSFGMAGANGQGSGVLNDTAYGGTLSFVGVTTLDNMTLNFGNAAQLTQMNFDPGSKSPATVTFGAGFVLHQVGSGFINTADTLVNNGTINATAGNVQLSAGLLSNAGVLQASGGAVTVGGVVLNTGNILANSGAMQFLGGIANTGTVTATGAQITVAGAVTGTGRLDIGANGSLSLLSSVAATQSVDFLSATGLLQLAKTALFSGKITGFGAGDQIDLQNVSANGDTFSGGALHLTQGKAAVATLAFTGSYSAANFTLGSDGHGGTLISFHS